MRRLWVLLLLACGEVAMPPEPSDAGSLADAGAPDAGSAARFDAVTRTASTNAACTALGAFYWELGDASGPLAAGAVGTQYGPATTMTIASASKWVFGAYVVERFQSDLNAVDLPAMTMRSGYVSFKEGSCKPSMTLHQCWTQANSGGNDVFTPAQVGLFHYDGAHFMHYADDALGLGDKDKDTLGAEVRGVLGEELALAYAYPHPAGGLEVTPAAYAAFLRKLLGGGLALSAHLGERAVCTLAPGCSAATSGGSPAAPHAWHYSYGHWVEDDADGDGAFSSAGAEGFYPWIDAQRRYYGLLARQITGAAAVTEPRAGMDSALCGIQLRRAFFTGVAQ